MAQRCKIEGTCFDAWVILQHVNISRIKEADSFSLFNFSNTCFWVMVLHFPLGRISREDFCYPLIPNHICNLSCFSFWVAANSVSNWCLFVYLFTTAPLIMTFGQSLYLIMSQPNIHHSISFLPLGFENFTSKKYLKCARQMRIKSL